MTRVPGVIVLLLVAFAATAQGPSANWRTIETKHFRVHYPVEFEAWSTRAASRLESIRGAVTREVGYEPPQTIDVVIGNPIADPNGVAWPLLDAPRILFYIEPPGPEEVIGSYTNWIDLLAVHEITHIVHMLRPSRNPIQHLAERVLLPISPITLAAPRWVLEGYATVIEGRLTGAGRPSGTMRAMILRKWASTGRLPSYSELDSSSQFLGMSMAYLAGSAYLEWLEQRAGAGSLRKLWARLTAREGRSFDQAFTGVFGDSPERLYGQFTAELTASAIAVNRAGTLREGELWQETPRASGDPAVSPDGSQLAIVIRRRMRPASLVVWSTGPQTEEEKAFQKRLTRILERDPEDVAPVRTKPLPRKTVFSLTMPDGGDISDPRWTADGHTIIFSHRQTDADGVLHHDLFQWRPAEDESRSITHFADVEDADPIPKTKAAVAIRTQKGFSQLVRVDLESGAVTPITEPTLDRVEAHPRVSHDGSMLSYVSHRDGVWKLITREMNSGREFEIGARGINYSSPEWANDGRIFAIASSAGHAEVQRIRDESAVTITRSIGGAFSPAPSRDGRVYFMSLEPDGFNVRVIAGDAEAAPVPPADPSLVPAVPPAAPTVRAFETQAIEPARRYGIGRQELTAVTAQSIGPSRTEFVAGARAGDVIGRLDTLALGSFGNGDAEKGGALAAAWRGWPVAVSAHIFGSEQRDARRHGLELRGSWDRQMPLGSIAIDAGGLTGKPLDIGFITATARGRYIGSVWRADASLRTAVETGTFDHYRAIAAGSLGGSGTRLGLRFQHDRMDSDHVVDVGGLPSSVIPRSADSARVFDPALPIRSLVARSYTGARAEVVVPGLPFTVFYQRHQTPRDRISLAGVEIALRSEPYPILRLPALDFTAGAARTLDGVLKRDTKLWVGLRWLP